MTTVLRPWRTADAADLQTALSQADDLARQFGDADLASTAACAAFIAEHLEPRTPQTTNFAVDVDGRAVGNVGVSHVEHRHDTAWTSYWIAADRRRRGLATAALASLSTWAFGRLDLFRIELGHRTDNPASCGVATAAGYPAEGLERAKLRYGSARFDVETHARLLTDPSPGLELLTVRAGL